jgi:anti-sigma B factor antagonist
VQDDLRVTIDEVGELSVVRVEGELDSQTSHLLITPLEKLLAEGERRVILDLSACTFVDSGGSRAIGLTARDGAGPPVGIVCQPDNRRVMMVLELVGLVDLMDIRPSLDEFLDGDG